MASLVLDTHSAIWYLESSPRLSVPARQAIQAAIAAGDPVFISTVTVVELVYLVEKGRIPATLLDQLLDLLRRPDSGFQVATLDLATAERLQSVPGAVVRDMPDRMIAATALTLGLPLVTRDPQIQRAGITTFW